MLPRRSSSNGQRRSSILKPPKSRQPFQDLDFNTSSPEISPESTKRRRVSFAEKKHVKEFCDHKEQGTIWDNTYEEADQNISKSIENGNENGDRINAENINIISGEAGLNFLRDKQDLVNSETYVTMDPIRVENSTDKSILTNIGTELDFSNVIPCSRGTSNYSMSRTILSQDDDLDITEVIGGIEPTMSMKKVVDSQPGELRKHPCIEREMRNTEKTMMFDVSGAEMNFTEVIKSRKLQKPTSANPAAFQDLEKTNSLIENQTIIFEDSIMDLTLTKSPTETDLAPSRNNDNANACEASNKTVFFDDFACEMTEAICTMRKKHPEVDPSEEKLAVEFRSTKNSELEICAKPGMGIICSAENNGHDLLNGSDSTLRISDTHGNKTILFNDFGCEMTEAIGVLKSGFANAENTVEKNNTEQIVPQLLPLMNHSITDMEMEIEPVESRSISPGSKTNEKSSPKLISRCNNRTEFFNDSAMEFTTAITGKKSMQKEVEEHCTRQRNKTIVFDNCNVDITEAVKTPPYISNSGSDITREKSVQKDSEEHRTLERNKTIFFDNSNIDITEAVKTPPCILNSRSDITREKSIQEEAENHCPLQRNKTMFFDNCNVDITEAVKTPPCILNSGSDVTREKSIQKDADEHHTLERNKTIFFDNSHIDITEAVKTPPCIVNSESHITGEKPVQKDAEEHCPLEKNKTVFFDNSHIDITEAVKTPPCILNSESDITREKSIQKEAKKHCTLQRNETIVFDNCNVDITESVKTPPCILNSGSDATREKSVQKYAEEHCPLKRNKTVLFDNSYIDITEAVITPPCISKSVSQSEEIENLLSSEFDCSKSRINKKRKSDETEANIDCRRSSHSSMSKSGEHDLVQSLVHDESTCYATKDNLSDTFAPNCKRLKVADENAEGNTSDSGNELVGAQTKRLEDIMSKTITVSQPNTEDLPETQNQISADVEAANDSANGLARQDVETAIDSLNILAQNDAESIENVPLVAGLNCSDNHEELRIDNKEETEVRETRNTAEDDVIEEESAFAEETFGHLNSDSESDILELSHGYKKEPRSLIEKSYDTRCLEPNKYLDSNDDCCFVMFCEELEKHAESKNCIWTLRSIDAEKVLIDFISKSLVIVIHLEATKELTTPKLIKDIQIISLLADPTDGDISMIHDILLKKLDPEYLKRFHRSTQDVVSMLEVISDKVKLLLDFMYEFDKLQDLHLIHRSGNRISFRLHSYKVQLVIKMTIDLEPFEEIGPNDVSVECILGNIREKDIKQLITSVKKDHKFLSNYINDIKEYIALVVEK